MFLAEINIELILIVAVPQLVIAGGLGALILAAFSRPFPLAGIVRTALIGATVFTALVVWSAIYSIQTSRSLTAGMGYFVLPFISVAAALISFVVIAALLYSVRFFFDLLGWTRKITTLWLGVPALLVVGLACLAVTLQVSRARLLAEAMSASNVGEINAFLENAVKHSDTNVLVRLARNPHVPPEILERIDKVAGPEDFGIKWALADNPHTPQNILSELVSFQETQVVAAVAANPNTPAETINQLADMPDTYVRRIVTAHPKISVENLQRLACNPNEDALVRESARLNLRRRGIPLGNGASE